MLALAAALSLIIGLSLGLLGGGGSILTTPILVYVVKLGPKEAITSSLLVVGVTSAVSTLVHARAGNVVWKTGIFFGLSGMVGAYVGGSLATYVRGTVLLVAFAAMMLVTAIAMIRGRRATSGDGHMHPIKTVVTGTTVGMLTGLVGAGGGFLIVPALILFGGVPMLRAVGTSLFVITLQSFAGFAGHVAHTHVQGVLLTVVTTAAVLGSLGGAKLAQRVNADSLRRGFAWFVLAMGLFIVARELPALATSAIAPIAIVLAVLVSRSASRRARALRASEAT
jgi:uncharacterized membrane protein YfcA